MTYIQLDEVKFPAPSGANANMMPIVAGDPDSVPTHLHGYLPLIEKANLERGKVIYLTVNESLVAPGETQRRPGIHTDGTSILCWGGGEGRFGGGVPPQPTPAPVPTPEKGIYMASTDGRCRVWDCTTYDVDAHGSVQVKPYLFRSEVMRPNTLYWMTDRTPHESLPSLQHHCRQFFRLVSNDVSMWWAQHSTANPLGVRPDCHIEYRSKFAP